MEDGTGRLGLKRHVIQSLRQGVLRKSPTSRLEVCCGGVCLLQSSRGVLTELVRAGEVTQRRDVRGPPGSDQTVDKVLIRVRISTTKEGRGQGKTHPAMPWREAL